MTSTGGGRSSGPGRRRGSGDRSGGVVLSRERTKEFLLDTLQVNGLSRLLSRLLVLRAAEGEWTCSVRRRYLDYVRHTPQLNVSHMIADVMPEAVDSLPAGIRQELSDILWEFASEHIAINDSLSVDSSPSPGEESDLPPFLLQPRDTSPDPGVGENVPPSAPPVWDRGAEAEVKLEADAEQPEKAELPVLFPHEPEGPQEEMEEANSPSGLVAVGGELSAGEESEGEPDGAGDFGRVGSDSLLQQQHEDSEDDLMDV